MRMFVGMVLMLITASAFAIVFPQQASADTGRKVIFPKGKKSVSYSSKLPSEMGKYYYYLISARKGQKLTVKLDSKAEGAMFAIYGTTPRNGMEDVLLSFDHQAREFSDMVPDTKGYWIRVYNEANKRRPERYKITITLE